MTKKFTEEQYQKIVDAWDKQIWYKSATQSVIDELRGVYINMGDQALALANPLTREWAHNKFVEKEPEFHFILKDARDLDGWRYHLDRNGGAIVLYPFSEEDDDNPKFKESEVKLWGFNPDMFDKE